MPATEGGAFDLPKLRVSFGFEDDTRYLSHEDTVAEFFDVKFCPWQPLDANPVFAAVSKKHVVVCRLLQTTDDTNPCEIVSVIRDGDEEGMNCCCTWTRDAETGKPYLCLAGKDSKVKIYDVVDGKLVTCFVGHGGEINDLATSPVDPLVIASASDDTTVRLWSLSPVHAKQPCMGILGGEGHHWSLLSVAFHDSGRYVLSAGHDQVINLWTLPDLPTEPIRSPIEIHYPHFSTSEVHSGLVDCVAFYGDHILSRACHDDVIVLWRIEGFSSNDPPPPQNIAPTTINPSLLTRSAFTPVTSPECPSQYTRLMEFYTPGCGPQFFMRFKLHFVPDHHPVLAFCNATGKIFFWDFERITSYQEYIKAVMNPKRDPLVRASRPSWLVPIVHRQRGEVTGKVDAADKIDPAGRGRNAVDKNVWVSDAEKIEALSAEYSKDTLQSWDGKYNVANPHVPLRAHRVESFGTSNFVGRQVAWSPGGEWCVVVGSSNFALVLQRWALKRD